MTRLTFTDGEVFETDGELRTEQRKDGWYVIGQGRLIPVRDEAAARQLIEQLKSNTKESSNG